MQVIAGAIVVMRAGEVTTRAVAVAMRAGGIAAGEAAPAARLRRKEWRFAYQDSER